MHQYFIEEEIDGEYVELNVIQSHHVKNVLRMKVGKEIQLVDSRQQVFLATITYDRDRVLAKIIDKVLTNVSAVQIELQACLIKGDRWDMLLQKTSELGVHTITPVQSRYCMVKIKENELEKKRNRWETITSAACEQSKRHDLVNVNAIVDIKDLDSSCDLKLVAYEDLNQVSLSLNEVLRRNSNVHSVSICVGSEGGFHPNEIEQLLFKGYVCVHLGKRILRAETAGIVGVDRIMNYYEEEVYE